MADAVDGEVVSAERMQQAKDRDRELRETGHKFAELYVVAMQNEDWKILGYGSEQDWQASVFDGVRLAAAVRQRIAAQLHEEGKSVREIAAATGVSKSTAQADLSGVQKLDSTSTQRGRADTRGRVQPRGRKPGKPVANKLTSADMAVLDAAGQVYDGRLRAGAREELEALPPGGTVWLGGHEFTRQPDGRIAEVATAQLDRNTAQLDTAPDGGSGSGDSPPARPESPPTMVTAPGHPVCDADHGLGDCPHGDDRWHHQAGAALGRQDQLLDELHGARERIEELERKLAGTPEVPALQRQAAPERTGDCPNCGRILSAAGRCPKAGIIAGCK